MKQAFLITLFSFVFLLKGITQRSISKSLFFYQDTVSFSGCGVIKSVDILYFVSDTSSQKKKRGEYYIAVKCAETYGENFFKKGKKYKLQLSKNFTKIRPYISPSTLKEFTRQKNFFVAEKLN